MVPKKSLKHTKHPLVSVLMPAYNAEKYIGEAIESIIGQTFKDFEFIIIDDASTDNTWEIIKKFAKKDKRIKILKNKKNLYIAANRNELIKLASGKYIAWQDADDISLPNRLEHQYKFMEKNPTVGIVGGFLQFFNSDGNKGIRKYHSTDRSLRKKIFRYSPVAQPAAMIRKICFQELGYYDLKYPPAEDIDMSFRIGTKYKFANLSEIILNYRESENSATYKRVKFILRTTLIIRKRYWKSRHYSPSATDKLYNIMQYMILYLFPSVTIIPLFNLIRNRK